MNIFSFIDLLQTIYGQKLPDIEKIQKKGLLAVKIAQHYALRIDFLNEDVCRHLAKLYRHNIYLPEEKIDLLLNSYVDKTWFDNFDYFNKTPIASASIGQVHRVRIKNGTEVAVKIIKKDFKNDFFKDINSLKKLFKFIIFFYPKLSKVFDPIGILEHIEDYTVAELDLSNEIKGQEILKQIHSKYEKQYNLSRLKFPKLYKNISNSNVMVSEYIEAQTLDALLEEKKLEYKDMLELFHIHGFYMFGPGTFHGDIHPGNILLDKDKNFYFIDTSAVSNVGSKIKKGLFYFFKFLSFYDYEKSAYFLNKMAETEIGGEQYKKFQNNFIELYSDFTNKTVSQASLTKKMMQTIKLGVNSGMVFEKGMFGIIKSLMYLDGMVLRCNPDAFLIKDMRAFIDEMEDIIGIE